MRPLFTLTAIAEAVTGLALLVCPPIVVQLLFGAEIVGVGTVISRVAGAALLSIGVACWFARNDSGSTTQRGLLIGVLTYDLAAAGLLGYAGLFLELSGIALWPAVVAHVGLALWCVAISRLVFVPSATAKVSRPERTE